jgi:hypothetical protein
LANTKNFPAEADLGQILIAECRTDDTYPIPKIFWTRNGQMIDEAGDSLTSYYTFVGNPNGFHKENRYAVGVLNVTASVLNDGDGFKCFINESLNVDATNESRIAGIPELTADKLQVINIRGGCKIRLQCMRLNKTS